MLLREVKKGDWIVNAAVEDARPWLVTCKHAGMVVVRRGPKIGKLTALTSRQLKDFKMVEARCVISE